MIKNKIIRQILHLVLCVVTGSLTLSTASPLAYGQSSKGVQAYTRIYDIQGEGSTSPLVDARTDTVGVVTAVTPSGFYLQDPEGDGLSATSDGIYVYTYDRPTVEVGECVAVLDGLVQEFYGKTELSHIGAVELSDHCAGAETVLPVSLDDFLQRSNAAMQDSAGYELFEGMLVELDSLDAIVYGPSKRYASGEVEMAVLPSRLQPAVRYGRFFRNPEPERLAGEPDVSSLMYLSNLAGARLPNAQFGDRVLSGDDGTRPLRAILDYNFGKYQLLPLPNERLTLSSASRFVDRVAESAEDSLSICSYNLHGFGRGMEQLPDGEEYAQAAMQHAAVIAESLRACTIIALQETGTPKDAATLADVLLQEYRLPYDAVALEGPGTRSSEFPLTNSFLVRIDQVVVTDLFSIQGCSDRDYGVNAAESQPCPQGQYPLFNRPPLVIDVEVEGDWDGPYTLRLINNHWKSKAGDEDVNEVRRMLQSKEVADFTDEWLAEEPERRLVVLGDLNDFYGSTPITLLEYGAEYPLVNVWDYLPESDRYSYIFNGVSQILDYILITSNMLGSLSVVDVVHQNADLAACTSYSVSDRCQSTDHDALFISLRPDGAAFLGGDLHYPDMAVTVIETESGLRRSTMTAIDGQYRIWGLNPVEVQIQYAAPGWIQVSPQQTTIQLDAGYNRVADPDIHLQPAVTAAEAVSSLIDAAIAKR